MLIFLGLLSPSLFSCFLFVWAGGSFEVHLEARVLVMIFMYAVCTLLFYNINCAFGVFILSVKKKRV